MNEPSIYETQEIMKGQERYIRNLEREVEKYKLRVRVAAVTILVLGLIFSWYALSR